MNKKHWNEEQIEEAENKWNCREIEALQDERKEEMKTEN